VVGSPEVGSAVGHLVGFELGLADGVTLGSLVG
jgi:hypothetical protein